MRFVSPETVRIDLPSGDWIRVKGELNVGEEKAFRARGLGSANVDKDVQVDWAALAFARVEAYLVDWSARDASDTPVAVTPAAIRGLDLQDFEEIDAAIQAHQARVTEAKKARSGTPTLTVA